ncbi:helix-turn-helix domain-containing protein [Neisseria bergeri]|uniref:helix-turn-helix domain-containing protein n=1 Tax=Neisseria bergeri TaxID=1906581 RepID=UPI0027E18474|nr:helix-turn-helix transcriptional regulator [Neisseria bergeri]
MVLEKIGARVRELRKAQNLSQEKFALKAEIDRTYLAGIEQGKRNLSMKNMEKIINALGTTFHQFFEDI